jgi:hypothetical protein
VAAVFPTIDIAVGEAGKLGGELVALRMIAPTVGKPLSMMRVILPRASRCGRSAITQSPTLPMPGASSAVRRRHINNLAEIRGGPAAWRGRAGGLDALEASSCADGQ